MRLLLTLLVLSVVPFGSLLAQEVQSTVTASPRGASQGSAQESDGVGGASHFIGRFDANADGQVTRDEFKGPMRHFDALDANHDGVVTGAEAAAGPRPKKPGAGNEEQSSQVKAGSRSRNPGVQQGAAQSAATGSLQAAGPGLEVVTVGTGSPLYNPNRSRPCMLIRYGGQNILCDMGSGTALRLEEEKIRPNTMAGVLFTHHHRDHDADAMVILPTLWQRGCNVPIVGPKGTADLVHFLRTFYDSDLKYRTRKTGNVVAPVADLKVIELPAAVPDLIHGLHITTTEVPHSITTFAYRFDAGGQSVVISGDLAFSEQLIALAKGANILVCDSGAIPYVGEEPHGDRRQAAGEHSADRRGAGGDGGMGSQEHAHPSMQDIARMAAESGVDKLVLVHFRPGTVDEEATRDGIGAIFSGEIIFAKDLQVITP